MHDFNHDRKKATQTPQREFSAEETFVRKTNVRVVIKNVQV